MESGIMAEMTAGIQFDRYGVRFLHHLVGFELHVAESIYMVVFKQPNAPLNHLQLWIRY